jgi:hypothetical protein
MAEAARCRRAGSFVWSPAVRAMNTFSSSSFLLLVLWGCGPSAGSGAPCVDGQTRCMGDTYLACEDGELVEQEMCASDQTCVPGIGCDESCEGDSCGGGGEGECAGAATEFVFVVDTEDKLYAFDPAGDAHTFSEVGTMSCPAGPSLGIDGLFGPARPFSMSVDRDAVAWVLYSSGEIFRVSTEEAACTATGFQKRQQGYDVFGMGFVSDQPDGASEKLYVAGSRLGPFGELVDTKIGTIDVDDMQISHLGNMPSAENPPELTGTGDARLFGYFPGEASTIAELDKTTGQKVAGREWPAGSIGPSEQLMGWAFAQWGGRFYVFVTTQAGLIGGQRSKIVRVDPEANGGAGEAITVEDSGIPVIVGAGVSTCAPVVVE